MRMIQYPTTLMGGYCLFNHPDATNSEDYGSPKYPGIRMSVIEGAILSEVANAFRLAPIGMNDNPDFMEHFRQTLLGKKTYWKIVRVVIDHYSVGLQFASEHYYKEHYRISGETDRSKMSNDGKTEFINSLPEYIGYASLEVKALRRVVLRFEVLPHEGCKGGNVVDVSLSQAGPVMATEYDGHTRRTFEIRSPQAGKYGESPAIITEYI